MQSDYKILFYFTYSSIFSALLPFFVGVIRFKDRSNDLKLLCILSILGFCLDGISQLNPSVANLSINLFSLLEFFCLIYIYRSSFQVSSNSKILLISVILIYLCLFSAEILLGSKVELNSYSLTFTSLLFIVISVRCFYLLMRDLPTDKIQRLPMFWINTGVLIYFAGGLFLFAMRNYFISTFHDDQTMYWSFHNFLNIGKNLLFAVALWQDLRKPKPI